MKRQLSSAVCGIAATILLGLSACPATADDCTERPFTFQGNDDGQLVEEKGSCFTIVGTGNATHMGGVVTINEICQHGPNVVNHNTLIAARGDELYVVRETTYNPDTQRFEGIFTIVGGTGLFENATGEGIAIQGQGLMGVICY